MRAVGSLAFLVAVAVAGACSLSLDGNAFLDDSPATGDAGGGGRPGPPGEAETDDDPDAGDADASSPDADDTCRESCGGGDCSLSCPERQCDCVLDCAATFKTCKPKCEHRDCSIDCRQVDTCEAVCKDAQCDIDCTGARECDYIKCDHGAGCLLDCSGAEVCDFDVCEGEVVSCPNGVLACNRACP